MTRTVKVVGGVVTAIAVAILLAYAVVGQGVSGSSGATYSGSYESLGPAGSSPGRSSTAASRTPATCLGPSADRDGLDWVCLSDLPKQAQQTVALIDAGGPFPYAKDGATFNNFEGVLPSEPKGYYREYTVKTPGEGDRGARRIVTGDHDRELFYTDNHYDTFVRVQR